MINAKNPGRTFCKWFTIVENVRSPNFYRLNSIFSNSRKYNFLIVLLLKLGGWGHGCTENFFDHNNEWYSLHAYQQWIWQIADHLLRLSVTTDELFTFFACVPRFRRREFGSNSNYHKNYPSPRADLTKLERLTCAISRAFHLSVYQKMYRLILTYFKNIALPML